MGQSFWKIKHVPFRDNGYIVEEATYLSGFRELSITRSDGDSRSSFSFVMPNSQNKLDNFFKNNDKIEIYRVTNTEVVPEDASPLIVGSVRDTPIEYTNSQRNLRVEGVDYSETLFSALTFVDATKLTIDVAIKQALERVNQYNTNFAVQPAGDFPQFKSNGEPFPVVGKRYFYRPLRLLLKELSTNVATQDGQYYWYVDSNSKLVWKKGSKFGASTYNEVTDKALGIKIDKDIQGVRNFIIAKGGFLPSGTQIQTYFPEYTSIAKHGFKFHIFVSENKTVRDYILLDLYQSYQTDTPTSSYPKLDVSFTTSWEYIGLPRTLKRGTPMLNKSKVTINTGNEQHNKEDYNEALYWQMYTILQTEAARIARDTRYGKIMVDIVKRPQQPMWGVSQVITTQLKEFGMEPKQMRVKTILYTEGVDTYTLTEDIGTL